mgnify:CR=1 FL=1
MPAFPAPAKLNLFLHVVGRRADGYHLLQSVFRFVDFGDTVHIEARADGRIVRAADLPGVTEDADLTLRAARLLQPLAAPGAGATLRVEKRLPLGGGLGGGSSDAATVLLALNRLWNLNLSRERLRALGLQLGADVPVFVFGETAFAEGIGEILSPVAAPPAWYVVLVPPVAVSTPAIFSAPELTRDTPLIKMPGFSAGMGRNDLQPVVLARHPEVAACLNWLAAFGDARMTGSGACVFAAFDSEAAARAVYARMPAEMQGFVARGLDVHPLRTYCDK